MMKEWSEINIIAKKKFKRFGLFIFNYQKGTFLNRRPLSWGWLLIIYLSLAKIFIYYVVFYICLFGTLTGFILFLMNVIIDEKVPYLTGQQSLLKLNPGQHIHRDSFMDNSLLLNVYKCLLHPL